MAAVKPSLALLGNQVACAADHQADGAFLILVVLANDGSCKVSIVIVRVDQVIVCIAFYLAASGQNDDAGIGSLVDDVNDAGNITGVHPDGVHTLLDKAADLIDLRVEVSLAGLPNQLAIVVFTSQVGAVFDEDQAGVAQIDAGHADGHLFAFSGSGSHCWGFLCPCCLPAQCPAVLVVLSAGGVVSSAGLEPQPTNRAATIVKTSKIASTFSFVPPKIILS